MSSDNPERQSLGLVIVVVTLVYLLGVGAIALTAAAVSGGGSGAAAASSSPKFADITLNEFTIGGSLTVAPGDVTLNVTNKGSLAHNLTFVKTGQKTGDISPGASETMMLKGLQPGSFEVICGVAGHADSGMKATLVVSDASAGSPDGAAGATPTTAHEMTHEEAMAMDDAMMKQMASFATDAAKTKGAGNTPLQPTIAADGTKEFSITAAITKWEVEPGKVVDAWTYNGQVPGPWIKVNVGDHVRLKVTNELPLGTDVHFHGIHVPNAMDGVSPYSQKMIEPHGGTFTYDFVADQPALGMYHAHMHAEEAVPNGMFAVFQIGDVPLPRGKVVSGKQIPTDLKIVDQVPMVLNDAGVIGFSLNGKSFPSTAPVVVNQGDWFEVDYFNEGLQNHPMHLHGFPQLVVAKDGIPLDQPYWVDTLLVGPGERYSLLVHATDVGTWVWHCHILNHVEMKDRLFGMATAVVVKDPNKGG